jgi:hypothetical protein
VEAELHSAAAASFLQPAATPRPPAPRNRRQRWGPRRKADRHVRSVPGVAILVVVVGSSTITTTRTLERFTHA